MVQAILILLPFIASTAGAITAKSAIKNGKAGPLLDTMANLAAMYFPDVGKNYWNNANKEEIKSLVDKIRSDSKALAEVRGAADKVIERFNKRSALRADERSVATAGWNSASHNAGLRDAHRRHIDALIQEDKHDAAQTQGKIDEYNRQMTDLNNKISLGTSAISSSSYGRLDKDANYLAYEKLNSNI